MYITLSPLVIESENPLSKGWHIKLFFKYPLCNVPSKVGFTKISWLTSDGIFEYEIPADNKSSILFIACSTWPWWKLNSGNVVESWLATPNSF